MINRDLCYHCEHLRHWTDADEEETERLSCAMTWYHGSIFALEEPPDNCPYLLEHVLTEEQPKGILFWGLKQVKC
jgi:hypothetical protein